ncbi:hypothetical protein [Lederbergia galactosidilytica]|uniref:ABC transporter periplasmic binding protein yphF n=1 Tax=Lederbergia galactosidilytica TaxID=217031 RepID=A0A0Q9Y4J2_9BACI|nr:hypothetical protein [Lederbergia galactosidilytica]KRG12516.1 hypothetical protein ACA30_19250 [Virgibacillus soli]KRG15949.1 hypothetical protein ACA29_05065 [Lederbergia galactosidilytica]MBP1914639.1 hypothetical protein [Lederbergia galactosidilytica]OAK69772.1 hypothetical protein ABB05_13390 [Lederbergia galactosidilytica]
MKLRFIMPLFLILILSGCMYPDERKAENKIPYEDQLDSVQKVVEQFQDEKDGILPIKTRDQDTPIYIKYPIDFSQIVPNYLSSPPGNSFESGGIFQYVLIDVETDPTVKLVDLRIAEKIREIKIRLQAHKYPPFKEALADNVYSVDFSQLGYKSEPYVESPFSHNNLSFVMDGKGEIYVDYISDLYQVLKDSNESYQNGDNIINILTKDSPFVPAYSLPYTVDENNEPIYMAK